MPSKVDPAAQLHQGEEANLETIMGDISGASINLLNNMIVYK